MSLEKFAIAARRRLHESVRLSIEHVLQSDTAEIRAREMAVRQLREEIARSSKKQVIERVAYTWFNRFCALRYMDLQGFNKVRVITPSEGASQPEILQEAKQGYIDDEIVSSDIADRVRDLLSGRQSSDAPEQEAYRLLLVAVCNHYHGSMPFMFERIADYTELLLPNDLLSQSSILHELRAAMDEEACESIEVIGWLYQYYIAEKKDEVIGKKVKPEDIPAATQLFTPNWIVKYMVQNSLGAQWLATHPDSPLKGQMEFYIEPAEQTDEVNAQLAEITPNSLNPEEITLIDPACGSGHILLEAYDLFKAIYLERGYNQREIAQLIVEKNLFGLDIDERAAQLAGFALMMKGRADDRRFFERGVKLNVMALEETSGMNKAEFIDRVIQASKSPSDVQTGFEENDLFPGSSKQLALKPSDEPKSGDDAEFRDALELLVETFEHAKTSGSLIQVPEGLAEKLPALKHLSAATSSDLFVSEALKLLGQLVRQAEFLTAQYDSVVANPPYMGSSGMNADLKKFAKRNYPDSKRDLFACFMERAFTLARGSGDISMITMQSWMFLSSFQRLRERVLLNKTVETMAHLGPRAFASISGEVVQTTAFVLKNQSIDDYKPVFFRLLDGGEKEKQSSLLLGEQRYCRIAQGKFLKIPGSPLAYHAPRRVLDLFTTNGGNSQVCEKRLGLCTGDNDRFLRQWYEISHREIGFGCPSYDEFARHDRNRYAPHNKGGPFRRWAGNRDWIIKYDADSHRALDGLCNRLASESYYFRESLTWTEISSTFSMRALPAGYTFNIKGPSVFSDPDLRIFLLAYFNSAVFDYLLGFINQNLSFNGGDVERVPFVDVSSATKQKIEENGSWCLERSNADADILETSWDFRCSPLRKLSPDPTTGLDSIYAEWVARNRATIAEMKRLEEENNRLFIEAYGLQGELNPEVPIDQITLTVNPAYRYGGKMSEKEQWERFCQDTMKELVSYGVGCMFGRYSLDKPGLLLANAGDTLDDYIAQIPEPSFMPDDDNVLPILAGEWFVDDIAERMKSFLKASFGEEHFEENLAYLEDGLGRDVKSYFLKDFYKDHVKTYKKRPIYWLFSSPNGTFNALIYMHRYGSDTVSVILNDYLRPFKAKLEAKRDSLEQLANNPSASQRDRTKALKEQDYLEKQIAELAEYESEVLYPLATEQIEIDLDDGVKANYPRFGRALKNVSGLS